MAKAGALHPKKIALLHVAKRELRLADEDYRAALRRLGGVESAADLGPLAFERVIAHFEQLGFKSTWQKRTFGYRAGMASPAQIDLIRKLWSEFHGAADAEGMRAWLARFHHVDDLRFVSAEKAQPIIIALKQMAARKQDRR